MSESVCLTSAIDSKEEKDAATLDLPNAFTKTNIRDEYVLMTLRGAVAEFMPRVAPETHGDYATYESGTPILHTELLKTTCVLLKSALKFYIKVVEYLK